MKFDQQRVFSHEFAMQLAQTLYAECPPLAPELFRILAVCVGVDQSKAEQFAAAHRVSDPKINRGDLVVTLRMLANRIDSGRKNGVKKK
jgi:hypothetical protein